MLHEKQPVLHVTLPMLASDRHSTQTEENKDAFKRDMKALQIDTEFLEDLAKSRTR